MKVITANIVMSTALLALVACSATTPQKHKRHTGTRPAAQATAPAQDEPATSGCMSCGVVTGVVAPAPTTGADADKE